MEPPWVGSGDAVWAEIAAGSACTFPLYSPSLKSLLGFNQKQLTFLGVANDIGENVEIPPVIACNKFPPQAVLLVGAFPSFLGSGVLYLSVSQTVQSRPYWL
ncbi:NUCLEAR FUSION DEFECTIVE 4-like [Olea europaea subsp. europaea]|uniref:NUCLEAR FUSION DEFECTIVE 4-like n=1 Tax=Olea europaea subsp. europaea TaxID=158383 RepID=A0A8S0SMF4_OLEEU|nr:NUCLEAR FUSION DEFECTIVE 4-like [Olea europaea subsp. europaea]